jgi:hypothetical protein
VLPGPLRQRTQQRITPLREIVAAVTPAALALQGQLDAARARITGLEQDNAALRERVRALTVLVVEMSLEADGKANVIPLKR